MTDHETLVMLLVEGNSPEDLAEQLLERWSEAEKKELLDHYRKVQLEN